MSSRVRGNKLLQYGATAIAITFSLLCLVCFLSMLGRTLVYPLLLRSLPTPSGIVPETDEIWPASEIADFARHYEVDLPYAEVADFFREEMPKRGWRLVSDKKEIDPSYALVEMIFRGPYCFPMRIQVTMWAWPEENGSQSGTTDVTIYDHPRPLLNHEE
jgi:hypothetical protein